MKIGHQSCFVTTVLLISYFLSVVLRLSNFAWAKIIRKKSALNCNKFLQTAVTAIQRKIVRHNIVNNILKLYKNSIYIDKLSNFLYKNFLYKRFNISFFIFTVFLNFLFIQYTFYIGSKLSSVILIKSHYSCQYYWIINKL